jgi:hypothetical protein
MSNKEHINCYTDASYSKEKATSVIAYKIGTNSIDKIILSNVKNTQAEIFGIEHCIEQCLLEYDSTKTNELILNIYTDCQNAWKHDFNRLIKTKNVQLTLIKVKGHQKKINMNSHDLIFKEVDKYARKTLRNLKSSKN